MKQPEAITDRLPKSADAVHPFATVMVFMGAWGWVDVVWQEVKPGQKWAKGRTQPPVKPVETPRSAAWM